MQALATRTDFGVNDCSLALKSDIDGRMSKALKGKERFNRWGKHYLRALMRAHQLQQCTNFMDPGLQVFGGRLFKAYRSEGDTIFVSLPPPTPSASPALREPVRTYVPPAAPTPAAQSASAARPSPALVPTHPSTPPLAEPEMRTYYRGAGGG